MAKRKNDSPANDYIDQLQWQAQRSSRRRTPVRFEPKWKYKIVYRYPGVFPFNRLMQFLILIVVLVLFVKMALSNMLTENHIGTIIFGGILALMAIIFVFAIKDGSKDKDDDSNRPD